MERETIRIRYTGTIYKINNFARLQSGVFYHYTFPKQLSPPMKLFTIYEKSINKSYIYTNNDFIYKNISFILTNISLIYTFLRSGRK
jgi:hypothetical protein